MTNNNTQRNSTITQQQQHSINRPIVLRTNQIFFENRDVQRAGWLKYIPFAEKYSSSDDHKFWVVFAVYGSQTPYLEFYQKRQSNHQQPQQQQQQQQQQQPQSDGPVSKHSLINCRYINAVIETNHDERHNEFYITLSTHVIRLAADTDEVMWDWIGSLRTKLIEMNILQPAENFYSKSPILPPRRPNINNNNNSSNNTQNINQTDELYEPIFNLSDEIRRLSLNHPVMPSDEGPPPYECIFTNTNAPTTSTNNINQCSTGANDEITIHRPSFREMQVEKFRKEMQQTNGVLLKVRKKDCYNSIAFVDLDPYGVFIAGWKQRDHPYLHNTFHIGDKLISINGVTIETAQQAKQFIKKQTTSTHLDFIIRRVPFGQIYCLKRSYDGEDLGLKREKGTGQITQVIEGSVAYRYGLTSHCQFYSDNNNNNNDDDDDDANPSHSMIMMNMVINQHQNWFLTEINNRPLNLFFKNNEIETLLNAIGKEISILVQPYGFVKRLKRQLKLLKHYKDYIVQ
ncbi:hypothetical protein DERF_006311 [Dermatophagoides farinae]|uniref:Uncharacterized protein n=1 Tax=Dermatophagoides farinae TaxID=6954 RepID=A0A922I8R3_DERFA|nr:hypothetical protein DERF_006311 [Dermatophagoides farinae]